jgi:hypothetical protein
MRRRYSDLGGEHAGWSRFVFGPRSWSRFVLEFLAIFLIGTAAMAVLIVITDPYKSGRFGMQWNLGVVDESPRTADVSRGRDPAFNAAVIGDSRGQLLDPARLSEMTAWKFVQLSVPGSGPREQLTILRWFLQHHDGPVSVVLTTDDVWCTADPDLPPISPFPFWLYGSNLDYVTHMLRGEALDRSWRRIMLAVGRRTASDPAGYWDYEIGSVWHLSAPPAPAAAELASLAPLEQQRGFPAVEQLASVLSEAKNRISLVMMFPPVHATVLPRRDTAEAATIAQCKGALESFAQKYGIFLDFLVDGDMARDPMNFMDQIHYRASVARHLEDAIASALATEQPPRSSR